MTFKFGDINGDNYVSQAEADFIFSKIGTTVNTSNFCDPADAFPSGNADFDQDGVITVTDWSCANANVGVTGD